MPTLIFLVAAGAFLGRRSRWWLAWITIALDVAFAIQMFYRARYEPLLAPYLPSAILELVLIWCPTAGGLLAARPNASRWQVGAGALVGGALAFGVVILATAL